jgi:hypothetical protein
MTQGSDRSADRLHHVARLIAKGDPPEWLIDVLSHFVTNLYPDHDAAGVEIIERMTKATDVLLRYVPGFDHLPRGWQVLDVPEAMAVLSRIKFALTLNRPKPKPPRHRPTNIWRQNCAAIVLEAWKQCHGRPEPHASQLREACEEYWRAWGGEPLSEKGTPENWRRFIEKAAAKKWFDIEPVFLALRQAQRPPGR